MVDSAVPDGGEHNWGSEPTPSEAIIDALIEKTGSSVEELPPLYQAVDPDALNQLFRDRDGGTVTFSYWGHEVTVTRTGEIVVRDE